MQLANNGPNGSCLLFLVTRSDLRFPGFTFVIEFGEYVLYNNAM